MYRTLVCTKCSTDSYGLRVITSWPRFRRPSAAREARQAASRGCCGCLRQAAPRTTPQTTHTIFIWRPKRLRDGSVIGMERTRYGCAVGRAGGSLQRTRHAEECSTNLPPYFSASNAASSFWSFDKLGSNTWTTQVVRVSISSSKSYTPLQPNE